MQFTGSELMAKRNFFTQTGDYGFAMTATVGTTTGSYHFGLSGNAGTIDFTLQSGKLYYGTQFLHSYRSFSEFAVEGQFTSTSTNVIKDGVALAYNIPKPTGYFDYFYFNRSDPSMAGEFEVNVSGNSTPIYSITTRGYLFATGQSGVTGYFVNQSLFPIRVFDSEIQASQNYTFGKLQGNVAPGGTGTFVFSGDLESFDLSQPILTTFNTNFDDTSVLFTINDVSTLNRFVYLTGPTDFTFNATGILNRDLTYLNYSGGFVTSAYNAGLSFQLRYVSGQQAFTGVWDFFTGVTASALVSMKSLHQYSTGLISGSGFFQPNSTVNFQVTYSGVSGNAAQLIVSGNEVLNAISQTLTFNA